MPWGPHKVLEAIGASPTLERDRWGILVQRACVLITGTPYLGIASPLVVLKLALVQPVLKVDQGRLPGSLVSQAGEASAKHTATVT